jgi:hypothetical protein
MKRALALCATLVACIAVVPAQASAAKQPELIACLGAGGADGSFQTQTINTGTLPGVGLGLTEPLCVFARPTVVSNTVNNLLLGIKALQPPSGLPTQQDLVNLAAALQQINQGPLAALSIAFAACQALHSESNCSAVLGTALGSVPFPLGTVTLNGDPANSSCFPPVQSGTGSAFGGSGEYFDNINWTADYSKLVLLGLISGTATSPDWAVTGGNYKVSGVVGPSCGAGAKVLVLLLN